MLLKRLTELDSILFAIYFLSHTAEEERNFGNLGIIKARFGDDDEQIKMLWIITINFKNKI